MRTEPLASTAGAPLPNTARKIAIPNQCLGRMKPHCCKMAPTCMQLTLMRSTVVALLVLVGTATADKKIVDMTSGFVREAAACEMQEGGLALILTKTRTYVATSP